MIRFLLSKLLDEHSFKVGRRIEWKEVSEQTGIHRTTLSRMLNQRGYNSTVGNLDLLCKFFACQVGDIAVFVPDDAVLPAVTVPEVPPAQSESRLDSSPVAPTRQHKPQSASKGRVKRSEKN